MKILLPLFAILCLFWSSSAHAAPTYDTLSYVEVGSTNIASVVHTVGGGCTNSVLVANVYSYVDNVTVTSVTTTAGALTQLPSARVCADLGSSNFWCQDTWYRVGVSGSQTVTATMGAALYGITLINRTYCGVNQSTPFGTAVAQADNSVDVSSSSGDLVIDSSWSYNQDAAVSPLTGQTERYNYVASFARAAGSDIAGGGTITMSWTSVTNNTLMGVALKSPTVAVTKRRSVVVQ